MKRIILLLSCLFLLGVGDSVAQNYSLIYDVANEDVRTKMNSNKILGVNVLDGIEASQLVKVEGLTESVVEQINAAVEGTTMITSIEFAVNNGLINVVSEATFYRQDLEQLLSNFGITIVNYTATYSLKG